MGQLYWMADNDPVKIDAFMRMPLWDYWTILNNRLSLWEEEKKKAKK